MKKITTVLFMLLISLCFVLTGCNGSNLTMPQNYENPVSNGGFIVSAGNYVYFANTFKGYSSLTTKADNDGKNVAENSLKRLEISTSNKWFNLVKDEEQNFNYENVVNKIAGYETSNMYVVNDYLYFTSPNVHKNKENAYEFELSTLFRIKLDGSGLTEILTTQTNDAKFYLTKNKQLLIYDDGKIEALDLKNNKTSTKTLVSDVESVVFPREEEQDVAWLYYTTARDEEDLFTGNILNKLSIETGEVKEEILKVAGETITLIAQDYGRLFYLRKGGNADGLYSNDFSSSNSAVRHRTLTDGISDGTDLAFIKCNNLDNNSFVFIYNNNLYVQLISATNDSQAIKITKDTTTIQFINGSYVYYSTSNGIYRYSILDKQEQQISDVADMSETVMDFDGRYVYFFAKPEGQESETKYLFRADCFSSDIKTECIAEIAEDDIVEETEISEEE